MHLLVIEIWCVWCGVVWRQRPEARPGQRAALTDVGGTTVLISLRLCLALLHHQLAPTLLAKMTKKKLVILPVGWKFNRRFSKREKSGLSNEPGLLLCEAFRDSKVNTQLGQMVQCSKTKKLGFTGRYWAILDCTVLYWAVLALLGCTGLYWAVLGGTGLHWAVLDSTGLYWAELGCTWLY